jgi:iron complex outermembrane recepter protein
MRTKATYVMAGLAAASFSLGVPTLVSAESVDQAGASSTRSDESQSLQEIVVTAQQRRENLQSVPISVTAISGLNLDSSGITTTTQLAQAVAGLSMRVTYNQLEPTIRGVGTSAAGPGIENPVALYVDDVYYASQIATAFSMIDVEQVAVLKGPQGTLFGRNATGGVIQLTTRDPGSEPHAMFRSSIDNYRTWTSDAYVAGPVAENLSASFTGRYSTQGKGWGENLTANREIHKVYSDVDLRAKILFTPGDDTSIKLSGDYSVRSDSLGPNFRQAFPQFTTNLLPGYIDSNNRWDVSSQTVNKNRFISGGVALRIEHDLHWARLVNITGYRSDHLRTIFDPSASPTPGNDIEIDEPTAQFTEELRLVSGADQPFTWQAGLFFFHGNGKDDPLRVHIRPALTGGADLQIDIRTKETTRSLAGYSQATFKLGAQTNFTAGLRYTWEKRTFLETQEFFVFGQSQGLLPPTGLPPDQTYKKPTWRLSLDHSFTDRMLGYVSYNRGFKSGGYNSHAPDNPPFNPEVLDAYEVGAKTQWLNDRLRVNAAAFYYDYKNVQVAKYTTTSLIYNGAAARIYGLDVDLEAQVSSNWRVTAGVEWLHARYTEFPTAPFSTPTPGVGPLLYYADAKGKTLNNAPNYTANLAIDYSLPVAKGAIDFNLTTSYSSGYFQEPDNFLRQPAYTIMNAAVSWTAPNEKLNVKLFGQNLLDKAIATQLNTLPVPPIGYDADYASPPRLYGIAVGYKF